jgi:ribosomal protein S18 acetylase RimI-like enzyme
MDEEQLSPELGRLIDEHELTVRRVRRPDHDLLVTLEAYDLEAFGPTGLRTYDLAVVAEAGAILLAQIDRDTVGSCQLLRVLDEPAFFYVVGFYVRPEWQGRGLGRALLLVVADESRKLGAEGLVLTVAPDNVKALNLYRSAGFVDEAFVPHFYGEGEDRYILRWRFPEGGLPGGV